MQSNIPDGLSWRNPGDSTGVRLLFAFFPIAFFPYQ